MCYNIIRRCIVMRKITLSRDLLNSLYTEQRMTLKQISEELGVSRQTVANKLSEYGITIRNSSFIKEQKAKRKPKLKKVPDYRIKEKFEKVYKELKSIELVANHFNISQDTAFAWKKKHNIVTVKEYSQSGKMRINVNKPYADKEWLEKMYAQYSFEDLGRMLNCSPTTIQKWAKKFGIKSRTVKEQWELKSKNGARVVKKDEFDLQAYKKAYVDKSYSCNTHLPKGLKNFIISLYSACESCGYTEVLDLHHIDGDHNNNSPENHGVLCPNCHAKIHRLGIQFNDLVPHHISWETLLDSYQEAK